MLTPALLQILCCPETHEKLSPADAALVEQINAAVAAGRLRNRAGKPVTEKINGGLVRQDQKYLYPVRGDIPVMLIDEAIALPVSS
jgi:uncharacterized protein YbaR (Trm112 family)